MFDVSMPGWLHKLTLSGRTESQTSLHRSQIRLRHQPAKHRDVRLDHKNDSNAYRVSSHPAADMSVDTEVASSGVFCTQISPSWHRP